MFSFQMTRIMNSKFFFIILQLIILSALSALLLLDHLLLSTISEARPVHFVTHQVKCSVSNLYCCLPVLYNSPILQWQAGSTPWRSECWPAAQRWLEGGAGLVGHILCRPVTPLAPMTWCGLHCCK